MTYPRVDLLHHGEAGGRVEAPPLNGHRVACRPDVLEMFDRTEVVTFGVRAEAPRVDDQRALARAPP